MELCDLSKVARVFNGLKLYVYGDLFDGLRRVFVFFY